MRKPLNIMFALMMISSTLLMVATPFSQAEEPLDSMEITTEHRLDTPMDLPKLYPTPPLPRPLSATQVLWDNGPLVNSPGTGFGGADESVLQTSLGMSTYGYGHQQSAGNRIADDFTIPTGQFWEIENILFYAYQTGSTTTSTMTGVNYRIWDGHPGGGGTVIFGDTATNMLDLTGWSGIYRVLDSVSGNTQRPQMINQVSGGAILGPGTYWMDWQTDGSFASGPWIAPITITGQTTTGNGIQSTNNGATWNAVIDVGPQGFPFIINGKRLVEWEMDGLWHIVEEGVNPYVETYSPSRSFYYGRDDTGTFNTGVRNWGSLTSPPITISALSDAYLEFYYWYETETTWTWYDQRHVYLDDGGGFFHVVQLSGDAMRTWHRYTIDLTPYIGDNIRVRFFFDTIDSILNDYRGWYIDDITVYADGNIIFQDFVGGDAEPVAPPTTGGGGEQGDLVLYPPEIPEPVPVGPESTPPDSSEASPETPPNSHLPSTPAPESPPPASPIESPPPAPGSTALDSQPQSPDTMGEGYALLAPELEFPIFSSTLVAMIVLCFAGILLLSKR